MKLYELQQTFDEMTAQLKELDNCVSPDKNSEQYKMLWDDRAEIKGRISRLEKSGRAEECAITSCKGNDECLEHCPCDCHKKTSDEVWDEACQENTISKKDLMEFLRDEKTAAEQNEKDSQKKTNQEYYKGIIASMNRVREFINSKN
jgi:hypothetical protein